MGGFEPPHASTKNWCLTAWPHPNYKNLMEKISILRKSFNNLQELLLQLNLFQTLRSLLLQSYREYQNLKDVLYL